MKFDAVVGNPPYQEENGNSRKPPIYHLFYDVAFRLAPIVSLITPARFLFDAGQTPQLWNKKMLNDDHFKVQRYFPNTKDVFDSVDIKGGIVITLRNSNAFYGKLSTFTSYEKLNSIVNKVKNNKSFCSIKNIVSSQGIYRFSDVFFREHPEITQISGKGTGAKIISRIVDLLPQVFLDNIEGKLTTNYVKILSKSRSGRVVKFISRNYLQENAFIDTFNVSLPESNGVGAFDQFSSPVITNPGVGITDTFISIGTFVNLIEASNLLKYIKSKFLRALLGVKKATQHNPKDTWEFVPLQDFTENSDIDWSKSVAEIDQQLYKKYDLSGEEIAFIESKIKPMD